ncbi:indolepyruvate ferredoxin oxidoreductase subunit alpha [Desulfuromonas thiophila]|jgi:Fe-S-cluster-containing hydrogenase component 2|uniref:4Fe-4S dicluster domain-containing protein n=1 Tax=Desulfuromonas thiophila TaxID=57664 RepID=A0A1G6XGM8_9BACT|nr:4Fe-4S binding protein [Desulfuromonas thiophila]SDD76943.1 4Fe-4S dicluster domain-containing protein [Desulfuromonas thiophila]
MTIVIDAERCTGCGNCVAVCPADAIELRNGRAVLLAERCDFDGLCIPACPVSAIGFSDD